MVGLTMTRSSEKMFIFNICRHGLIPNLIKKSWTVSSVGSLTGADFYAITVDAMMAAIERTIDKEKQDLILHPDDFRIAVSKLKPSVSTEEMMYYKSLLQNKLM